MIRGCHLPRCRQGKPGGGQDLCRESAGNLATKITPGEKGDQPAGFEQLCSPSLAANSRIPLADSWPPGLHAQLGLDRQPAHRASPPPQPLAHHWPTKSGADARNPVMRPGHSWTRNLRPDPVTRLRPAEMATMGTGSTDHGPGQPVPSAPVPQPADQTRSGPPLAHNHRERSAEPLPDTPQTRHPGTPGPGLTWGFEWQVLGSNQRRLSRRFYRPPVLMWLYSL